MKTFNLKINLRSKNRALINQYKLYWRHPARPQWKAHVLLLPVAAGKTQKPCRRDNQMRWALQAAKTRLKLNSLLSQTIKARTRVKRCSLQASQIMKKALIWMMSFLTSSPTDSLMAARSQKSADSDWQTNRLRSSKLSSRRMPTGQVVRLSKWAKDFHCLEAKFTNGTGTEKERPLNQKTSRQSWTTMSAWIKSDQGPKLGKLCKLQRSKCV